jgi:hypothetical protein
MSTYLRYAEEGDLHLDFHGANNTIIDYVLKTYGAEALEEIFRKLGHDVYRSIREDLEQGQSAQLLAHWSHFFDREQCDYDIEIGEDEIVLTMRRCTAWHHVAKLVGRPSPHFCDQTISTNRAMVAASPFSLETEITGPGSCRQVLKRRER